MNGNTTGVLPTVELAGANNAYPVYPMMYGNGGGFGSGFGSDALWIILLLALFGWGNNGNGGFGNGFDNGYAWLSNGQKDIMNNTTDGFNSLHLSNAIEGVRDSVNGISNQLCSCCADMQQTVSNGFYNAEISANNRQMADMNQNFALSQQLSNASADNRLGIANLTSTVISENCSDRQALNEGIRDVIASQTAGIQRVLDQLCQDKIDEKNEKIADLQRQLSMADLRASQTAQNAFISQGFANEVDALYNRLNTCPVPTTPVYGRTPIFTCPANNGCGCGYSTTSQFI